jgi:hypothetical protein
MNRDAQRAAVRKHYQSHKPYYLAKNASKRAEMRLWLRQLKERIVPHSVV